MNETKIIAALLTLAVNMKRERSTSRQAGREDWRLVFDDYHTFLSALNEPAAELGPRS
ncbi:MAG: hypothetical protein WB952_06375 [Terriglobales bacterium]